MKINRPASFAALAFAGALALTACSSSSSTSSDGGNTDGPTIAGAACESGSLKASGSSAQANAMSTWISDYQTACEGATIDYQPTGSGAGVTDFINKQVAFAGSDSSLKAGDETTKADARCATGPALNIPMVGGAIALAYNVSGVDSLTLTPDIMAGIFSNTITKWNDPKIAAANTGATLPDASIAAFHRSDSSGTTDNFTKYLAATAPTAWTFGNDKVWKAQGGQAAKGNDGIGSALKATPNSIGYVELAFAQQNSLTTALVDNGGGAVEATSANAASSIGSAQITGTGNNLPLTIDYTVKTPGAYPIVLVTYEIACESGNDAGTLGLLKGFLTYTSSDEGQSELSTAGYVAITGDLLSKVRTSVGALS